jgi:plasmid stabilization system protein ParE
MARALVYTSKALGQIRTTFDYLADNFGEQASESLIQKIEDK